MGLPEAKEMKRNVSRRTVLAGMSAAALGVAAYGLRSEAISETAVQVQTTCGVLAGLHGGGVARFLGVPYGRIAAGVGRFLPAEPSTPWTGTRKAFELGAVCPQVSMEGSLYRGANGLPEAREECLCLNVWTPAADAGKRPVMVWLHGGGFEMGAGTDSPATDGANLARRGDVVVVTVNHRIGLLGFLDLSRNGAAFADSGNAGMLDLVLALRWVRDNIARFGGDAGNVTIFGQSGGGGKVTALLSMPAAQGLFHKAIVQSGSMMFANGKQEAADVAEAVLNELGLSAATLEQLHTVGIDELLKAGYAARKRFMPPPTDFKLSMGRQLWGPTLGPSLPQPPFVPAASAGIAQVPLMVGSTVNEFSPAIFNRSAVTMSEAQLLTLLDGDFGKAAPAVLAAAQRVYPERKPIEMASVISATAMFRNAAELQAERKSVQSAPVYLYQFGWRSRLDAGKIGAMHAGEIPYVFYNVDAARRADPGGPDPEPMARVMSDAWVSFAHTGNPNHEALPQWPGFERKQKALMYFDASCVAKNDFDRELREVIGTALGPRR